MRRVRDRQEALKMRTHEIKSWPDYFQPMFDGWKRFEVRIDDRNYQVGDELHIREFDDRAGKYTGREIRRRITYILHGIGPGGIPPLAGIHPRFVVMSLEESTHDQGEDERPAGAFRGR
jgi:hypothetical protein